MVRSVRFLLWPPLEEQKPFVVEDTHGLTGANLFHFRYSQGFARTCLFFGWVANGW